MRDLLFFWSAQQTGARLTLLPRWAKIDTNPGGNAERTDR
mgnify:CR=1 FL=1